MMYMKKIFYFLASMSLLWSCEKPTEPVAEFDYYVVRGGSDTLWNENPLYANEKVTFVNRGDGDYFVVYTGASESNYESRNLPADTLSKKENTVGQKGVGYTLSKSRGVYSTQYSYLDKGEYNVVYIASAVARKDGKVSNDINKDIMITVRDTVAMMSNIVLKRPIVVQQTVKANGKSIVITVPYGTTGLNASVLKFEAGKAVVYRGDQLVVKGFAIYEEKGLDLTPGKIVTYRLVAPDGNENLITVEVQYANKPISTNNDLLSATISKVKFTPASNVLSLVYPKGKTSEAVDLSISTDATVLVDGKDLKGAVKVSDLQPSGKIVVTSESKVAHTYNYTLKEEGVVVTPFALLGANSATGFLISTTAPGALSVYLATSIDASKLIPQFPQSKFTKISKLTGVNTLSPYKNGIDTVDFTSPVKFVFQNGTDSLVYEITVKQ